MIINKSLLSSLLRILELEFLNEKKKFVTVGEGEGQHVIPLDYITDKNKTKIEIPESVLKYGKKHKDEKKIYAGRELGIIDNPFFSEKVTKKNVEKLKEKNKITELAEKYLKDHPDYNPHEEFIKKQKFYKPYKYE